MPRVNVVVESEPSTSVRARQVEAMFDVPPREKQRLEWNADLPLESRDWNVGLIVGPSGCGKSTIARALFGNEMDHSFEWAGASVIDCFARDTSMTDIAGICQAVGFNTIPAWLRPFEVLSNGEKFRVEMARRLLEGGDLIVVDEFSSVVDRQVAQIGAHAIQKRIRKDGRRFVAVSCHYDIIEWLQPDWMLEPATMTFQWRSLRRRPPVEVEMAKVKYDAWGLFAPYHYMSADLHRSAQCYCAFVGDAPAVIGAMLYRPHATTTNVWGLSRVVTLPDWQGLGLAFVLMDALGGAFCSLDQRMHTYPAHPALIRAFDASPKWRLVKKPGMSGISQTKRAGTGGFFFGGRPNATFEWAGGAGEWTPADARAFLQIRALL